MSNETRIIRHSLRTIDLFGIQVVAEAYQKVLRYILYSNSPTSIMSLNLGNLRLLPELSLYIHDFDMVLPDGRGFLNVCRFLGFRLQDQIAVSTLCDDLLATCGGQRLFLLGATESVNRAAQAEAKRRNPLLCVAGRDGYFSQNNSAFVLHAIVAYKPDFVFVGMSSPGKERIIHVLMQMGVTGVCIACGGYLDILGGKTKRASRIMQVLSLEWVFRIFQEPRRLFGRTIANVSWSLFVLLPKMVVARIFRSKLDLSRLRTEIGEKS